MNSDNLFFDDTDDESEVNSLVFNFFKDAALRIQASTSTIRRNPRNHIVRDRHVAHDRLEKAYFVEEPLYDDYFFRYDAVGKSGIFALVKCTSAVRQLAYDAVSDALDEYLQIADKSSRDCLMAFFNGVMELYGEEFLRNPIQTDVENLYVFHEENMGFLPGSNDTKRIRYKQAHKVTRKDVKRVFGVLKKKWDIVRTPARPQSLRKITHLMYTCIILHSMIQKEKGKLISPDFYSEEQHRENDPVRSAQDRLRHDDGGTRKATGTWSRRSPEDVSVNVPRSIYRSIRMTGGLSRGTPGDNIGSTPAGVIGSTSGGPIKFNVETPRTKTTPSVREQIEGHLSVLRSLLKEHKGRGNVSPIHLSFNDEEDRTRIRADHLSRFSSAANSGEWLMPVRCRMFQQTLDGSARGWRAYFIDPTEITNILRKANKTLVAFKERWIVETGFITGVPEVMKISSFMDAHKYLELAKRYSDKVPKIVDEMMTRLDDFVRSKKAFANTELPKWEVTEGSRRPAGSVSRREDRFHRGGYRDDRRRNERRNTFNPRDRLVLYRAQTPYQAPRDQGFHHPKFNLSSLTKLLKEILASEPQLNLQPPRPMQLLPKKENQDKYCDYHGEKGHYNNDYFQLRRHLAIGLESGKLNHLIKDDRQRGRGNAKRKDVGKDKVINMIRSWPKDKKRKSVERDKSWMKAPIVFHPLSVEDALDDPLIIEAVMEGYLVRRMDLVGFAGGVVKPLGKIELELVFGDGGLFRTVMINFTVVRAPSPYNVIFGRTGLRSLRVVSSTIHSMVKFPPQGDRNLSHSVSHHLRMSKSELDGTDIGQPGIYESTSNNRGKPVGAVEIPYMDIKPGAHEERRRKLEDVYRLQKYAYKGYHQVQMAQDDEETTTFYTDQGTYCYTKMPFALKNAGATYQRLVDTAFQSQIGSNLEAYVDDMVIKRNNEKVLIEDIAETFDNLRRIN
nr:reverse transcriptase domain-containing protein [Tanacetum cinerariifolium]